MVPPWLAKNPRAGPDLEFGREQQFVINPAGIPELCDMLTDCPKHKPTPLYALTGLAAKLGLAEIRVKDESQRFGFGAFKALGGVIAVYDELLHALGGTEPSSATFADLMNGRHREITSRFTFATASSGNHGRSVAAGAKLFGVRCVVFLPKFTSAEKEAAIRARGATVTRVDGDYDTAVAECRRTSEANGWTIISDTSWQGYDSVPRSVMRGYCVLAHEAVVQQGRPGPTHVFVQAGVGGLAAAVCGHFPGSQFIIVEPEHAAGLFASARAGRPERAPGEVHTVMAGLECGEVSPIAWRILDRGADFFMTIRDSAVPHCLRLLAKSPHGDPPIFAGESAVAGLIALLDTARDPEARQLLRLDPSSRILLFGTEGITDPIIWRKLVTQPDPLP
jgi:diaminopropionate ammonia-lyase